MRKIDKIILDQEELEEIVHYSYNTTGGGVNNETYIPETNYEWSLVFWPFWIFCSLYVLLSFSFTVVLIITVYKYLSANVNSDSLEVRSSYALNYRPKTESEKYLSKERKKTNSKFTYL